MIQKFGRDPGYLFFSRSHPHVSQDNQPAHLRGGNCPGQEIGDNSGWRRRIETIEQDCRRCDFSVIGQRGSGIEDGLEIERHLIHLEGQLVSYLGRLRWERAGAAQVVNESAGGLGRFTAGHLGSDLGIKGCNLACRLSGLLALIEQAEKDRFVDNDAGDYLGVSEGGGQADSATIRMADNENRLAGFGK